MFKALFFLLIITSFISSDVRNEYPTDTLPDPLPKEDIADDFSKGENELIEEKKYKNIDTNQINDNTTNSDISSVTDTILVDSSFGIPDSLDEENELSEKDESRKSRLRRKGYNHRHQVGTALGMMVFITLILSFGASINPN